MEETSVEAEPIEEEYYNKLKMLRALQLDDYEEAEEWGEELADDEDTKGLAVIKKINEIIPDEIEKQKQWKEEHDKQSEHSETSSEFDSEQSESEPDSKLSPEEKEAFKSENADY